MGLGEEAGEIECGHLELACTRTDRERGGRNRGGNVRQDDYIKQKEDVTDGRD